MFCRTTAPGVRLPMPTNVSLTGRRDVERLAGGYVDRHGRQLDPARLAVDRGELVERHHVVLDEVGVGGVVPTARP